MVNRFDGGARREVTHVDLETFVVIDVGVLRDEESCADFADKWERLADQFKSLIRSAA